LPKLSNETYTPRAAALIAVPHPRIWIGGAGEKFTLRIVAKHADGWNVGNVTPEEYTHKLNVLREHCERTGTDFGRIEKSLDIPILITDEESDLERVVKWSRWFAEIASEGTTMMPPVNDLREMKQKYILGTAVEVERRISKYIDAGVEHFMFEFLDLPSTNSMRRLAQEAITRNR
jgi:alkanesulfonate monooxygenase SsuD/methylene tetrahydromethanopterin reductase-like flavin-dependent oxidoreductase (luciferase family)